MYFLETFYEFSGFFWYTVRTLIKTLVFQMSQYLLKNYKWEKNYKEEKNSEGDWFLYKILVSSAQGFRRFQSLLCVLVCEYFETMFKNLPK